jgi:excisionase family DNA binding protein
MPPPDKHLLTTTELAARYAVDAATVRRWAAAGEIPIDSKTPGGHYRFDPAAVDARLNRTPTNQEHP